jgi:hypothetical protein
VPDDDWSHAITDKERITRYIADTGKFNSATGVINFRVFLPVAGEDGPETSVMRTEGLAEDHVWSMGDEVVAESSARRPKARADFLAPHVRACKLPGWQLDIQPKIPPPRHARIIGWPLITEREAQHNLAQQLRAEAVLRVRESAG